MTVRSIGRSTGPQKPRHGPGFDDIALPGATSLPNRRITSIALGINDTQTAYVGFVGGDTKSLWKTANGGQTWTALNGAGDSGWSITGISVNPDDESKVTVNNNVDITFVSTDYGQTFTTSGWNPPGLATWSKISPTDATAELTATAIAPGDRDEVWVGFSNGELYQTFDATSETPTWERVDYHEHFGQKGPRVRIQSIAFPPNRNEGQAYVAYDVVPEKNSSPLWAVTGTTSGWGLSALTNPIPEKGILGVAIDPRNAAMIDVATDFGVVESVDFGRSWTADDRPLRVKYRDGGHGIVNGPSLHPHLEISNVGAEAVNLSELEIRYYYSIDAAPNTLEQVWLDYATLGSKKVIGTTKYNYTGGPAAPPVDADHYLSVTFATEAGQLQPGHDTGELQYRVNKIDWSNYDQTNDQSFDSSKLAYADSWRVALYRNGTLVWGVTP
ncbi:MAG: cellulose binding domain-containing protein [Polyangiaceae bacterium]